MEPIGVKFSKEVRGTDRCKKFLEPVGVESSNQNSNQAEVHWPSEDEEKFMEERRRTPLGKAFRTWMSDEKCDEWLFSELTGPVVSESSGLLPLPLLLPLLLQLLLLPLPLPLLLMGPWMR